MRESQKEFCDTTIETIEVKIGDLLDWINKGSSSGQDAATSEAVNNLLAARAALLMEREDLE